ncbi:MAG: DUF3795 domain-containing protein [Promethearchaeota archaeon]
MSNTQNLVAYCGLYCGACGIRQGAFSKPIEQLTNIIKFYGFDKEMDEFSKWEPAFKHYKEFEQVLDALNKTFGSCSDCRSGGGDPNCKIRPCASEKGLITCVECSELGTCEILKQYPWASSNLQTIKKEGFDSWLATMESKVAAGYSYLDNPQE